MSKSAPPLAIPRARLVWHAACRKLCTPHGQTKERTVMNFSWIGRNRSLELSPRVRLVDDIDARILEQKREALAWRPQNGFLKDERDDRLFEEQTDRAA
jgi:hypothetical protein